MAKGSKSLRDTAGILGTRVVWSLLGVISGILLARWLGPYDRGILALVLLVPSTVLTLVKLGVSQATVYFINRNEAPADQVASNSVILGIVLGTVSAWVVWSLRHNVLSSILHEVPDWALLLSLIRVPLLLIDNYLFGVLQAVGQFGMYNSRLLISEALRLVLVVLFVVVFNYGLPAAVATYTIIGFVNIVWLMVAMHKVTPFSLSVDPALLRRMLSFGVRSYVQVVTAHLLLRVDVYMVQVYLGAESTAFYALALHFTELVLEVPQAIGLVLYPKLTQLPEREVHRLTAQTCRRTLLATAPAALALGWLGPYIIPMWYGAPYAPAGAPLPWAAVGVVGMAIFVIITRDFTARSKQRVNTFSGLIALAINIALNLVLIPALGILGAALATAVAYTVACVILIWVFMQESGLSMRSVLLPTREDFDYARDVTQRGLARLGLGSALSIAEAQMADAVRVEAATQRHLDGIARCHQAAFPTQALSHMGASFLRAAYRVYLDDPRGCLTVALDGADRVVGFVAGGAPDIRARFMAVAPRRYPLTLAWRALVDPVVRAALLRRGADDGPAPWPSSAEWAKLQAVGVLPERQGGGVAAPLVEHFLAACAGLGFADVALSVDVDNPRAQAFYRRTGWQLVGETARLKILSRSL